MSMRVARVALIGQVDFTGTADVNAHQLGSTRLTPLECLPFFAVVGVALVTSHWRR